MKKKDKWHLALSSLLVMLSVSSLCWQWKIKISVSLIVLLCIYLSVLLMACACKASDVHKNCGILNLPSKHWALLLVLMYVLTNVTGFANIYLQSKSIKYTEEAGEVVMTEVWDAVYFSAVTVTTLGYGDFLPDRKGRKWVVFQLASGLLLLLFIVPVVASRITTW